LWEYRQEFEGCLQKAFTEVASRVYQGDNSTLGLEDQTCRCLERFNQVMMGAVNITKEDINETLRWAKDIQTGFYECLYSLLKHLPDHLEVINPKRFIIDPYWDSALIHGCNIKAGNCILHAVPRVPAATSCWMALVQEPVAAKVLAAKNRCVLMLPSGQYPSEDLSDALKSYRGDPLDVTRDFEKAYYAQVQSGILYLDSGEKMDPTTLNAALDNYGVATIVKVNLSQQTGFIYTGHEEEMPGLQGKIYYEWHENWKIYNT
jgi:hypothetical protein